MNTQVIFKIDKKIKEKAQKKARSNGTTFSDVLRMMSYKYTDGTLEPVFEVREELKPSVRKSLIRISEDFKKGKNLSPIFYSAKDAIAYLKKSI